MIAIWSRSPSRWSGKSGWKRWGAAEKNAEERILDLLMRPQAKHRDHRATREKLREKLRAGKLDDRVVEIDVKERGATFEISTPGGIEEMDVNLKDVLPGIFGQRTRKRKMRVAEAIDYVVRKRSRSSST